VTVAGKRILILGIGELLWADAGFGARCVEAMAARWAFPDSVTLLDGGIQGVCLLPHLEAADVLIVFDAIDYGLAPGTMKLMRGDDVPACMSARKPSLHRTGLQDVIATAELNGCRPAEMLLIGVQPEALEEYGGDLRPSVAAQIGPAIEVALTELSRRYRIHPVARRDGGEALAAAAVTREARQGGRTSEAEARGIGDARLIDPIAGAR
jgi:hydrogenase maturation protease